MTPSERYAVRTEGLTRRFGSFTAVDGVNLAIPAGHIYGFLGPNGSGKSTTIRMLCGLLLPSAGRVQVLGHEVPREAEVLRRKLGYMTQRFSLFEDLSVRENLLFMAQVFSLPKATRTSRLMETMRRYSLEDIQDQRAGTLSGGQKQRLALAAATLHQPEMLFLDEPTSAVDPQSRRDFWEKLFELSAVGTTILVSTHLMDEAERCHRLAILDHGVLVAEGEPTQLMQEIDALVVEIETPDPQRATGILRSEPYVKSVAQIGNRLHALLAQDIDGPEKRLADTLRRAGLAAEVRRVHPNLEDVFVAATAGPRRRERARA